MNSQTDVTVLPNQGVLKRSARRPSTQMAELTHTHRTRGSGEHGPLPAPPENQESPEHFTESRETVEEVPCCGGGVSPRSGDCMEGFVPALGLRALGPPALCPPLPWPPSPPPPSCLPPVPAPRWARTQRGCRWRARCSLKDPMLAFPCRRFRGKPWHTRLGELVREGLGPRRPARRPRRQPPADRGKPAFRRPRGPARLPLVQQSFREAPDPLSLGAVLSSDPVDSAPSYDGVMRNARTPAG